MGLLSLCPRLLSAGVFTIALASGVAHAQDIAFKDSSRIVSVGGSVTEIVFALRQESKLVGRDSTSIYPEAANELPDVGYMRQLSPEGVLSVNPSGLLVIAGSGPRETMDVLEKASIPMVVVPESYNHAGIIEKIRVVGAALGVEDKAVELAKQVDADISAAEELTAKVPEKKRILFILSVQGGKILASGSDTAASGIIELAGAVNAVEGYSGYKQLSDEAVILAKPDVIVMMTRGGDHAIQDDELFAHPAIAPTPAGQAKRILRVDGNYMLGFGPRTASAIRELVTAIYGDEIKG